MKRRFIVEVNNTNITAKGIKYALACAWAYSKATFTVKVYMEKKQAIISCGDCIHAYRPYEDCKRNGCDNETHIEYKRAKKKVRVK